MANFVYSMIVPQGQESELAGFYLYCTHILTALPPCIFTVMNEADVNLKWGGIHLNIYLFIGLVLIQLMLPWDECLEAAKENKLKKKSQETSLRRRSPNDEEGSVNVDMNQKSEIDEDGKDNDDV